MVYGRFIAPEDRVDPERFSETEFPLVCPRCEYSLRGLGDCPCPECGTPVDRGRLLVDQYVIGAGVRHPRLRRRHRIAMWCAICGWPTFPVVVAVNQAILHIWQPSSPAALGANIRLSVLVTVVLGILGLAAMVTSVALWVSLLVAAKPKVRQVYDAIERGGSASDARRNQE